MTPDEHATDPASAEPTTSANPAERALDAVLRHLQHAQQQLLGDTISVTDEQWRGPSHLPGWSRGHVATHIARQADAMRRVAEGVLSGTPAQMYDSMEARNAAIEDGSTRTGLELQTDLDTSAGAVLDAFDQVETADRWDTKVHATDGVEFAARLLPLGRLTEVALHHIDLDLGVTADDLDPDLATWLLEWITFRLSARVGRPFRILVATPTGSPTMIDVGQAGSDGPVISGAPQALVGWLSGRAVTARPEGADQVDPPAL
ncbi:MAG: maleylpyruvate isomerase family mycothiol-dependent enzyme [Propionibacteriales bacterium]|nr:maleylpyruvate isomerase family mycothiol-dependent enzyme [Propionibacteriales bacterium]